MTYTVLVTASRTWIDRQAVWRDLDLADRFYGPIEVLHGGHNRGGDHFASLWCMDRDRREIVMPAHWQEFGRAAGPIRNQAMVDTRPDLLLAYIANHSRGASGCLEMGRGAGLDCRVRRATVAYAPAKTPRPIQLPPMRGIPAGRRVARGPDVSDYQPELGESCPE